jgi:hypothetical protein
MWNKSIGPTVLVVMFRLAFAGLMAIEDYPTGKEMKCTI